MRLRNSVQFRFREIDVEAADFVGIVFEGAPLPAIAGIVALAAMASDATAILAVRSRRAAISGMF